MERTETLLLKNMFADEPLFKRTGCREPVATPGVLFPAIEECMPREFVVGACSALYSACSVLWEYLDTVIDICAQRRLPYSRQCREIRNLRKDYDWFHLHVMTPELVRQEDAIAESMDEVLCERYSAISAKVNRDLLRQGMKEEDRPLAQASLVAMCLHLAILEFSRAIDKAMSEATGLYLPVDHIFLQREIEGLSPVIGHFVSSQVRRESNLATKEAVTMIKTVMSEVYRVACEAYAEDLAKSLKENEN